MKKYNPYSILRYQLYLLQLENYELLRYWKLLSGKGFYFTKENLRKDLVWTKKVSLILVVSFVIILTKILSLMLLGFNPYVILVVFLAVLLLLPILFSVVVVILWPFDWLIKAVIIKKAKKIVSVNSQVKIIGIAGSYGKTTMKNVLGNVLSTKFRTIVTPDSVNTPVGIARWINDNLSPEIEMMIVEMGEHYRGDISYLCEITPPNFAVVTGINEAHLERMNNIENVTRTIFEIVAGSKEDATVIVNVDDDNIAKTYKKYVGKKETLRYGARSKDTDVELISRKFNTDKLIWNLEFKKIGKVEVAILGEYIAGDVSAAYLLADRLGLSQEEIKRGIRAISPVKHRLEPIKSPGGVLVIDDSYNGNPAGVMEAIYILEKFSSKRKLFITPGIVETGVKNTEIHEKIGVELANVADLVLLIRNSATPHIAEGLKQNGFLESQILWFDTAEMAHVALGSILSPNDVILFQNDWGDQYV